MNQPGRDNAETEFGFGHLASEGACVPLVADEGRDDGALDDHDACSLSGEDYIGGCFL